MNACPFCQRIEIHEYVETTCENVVRFEPLNPVTPGHMLFITDWHATHPAAVSVGRCMEAAEDYGRERGEQFNLIVSCGEEATQSIEHLHIHYVPRQAGDGLHLPWTGQKR